LGELTHLVALDPDWGKALAEAVVVSAPALAFSYARELLAVDGPWAHGLLQAAAQAFPYAAIRRGQTYLAEPWGPQLFTEAVLRVPQWVVSVVAYADTEGQAMLETLRQAAAPPLRVLAQIATSSYPRTTKVRMAAFVHDIVNGQRSLDEAARLSGDTHTYFRTLHLTKRAQPDNAVIDTALTNQALAFIAPINAQHEQPAAVRFRAVERFTAEDLYVLLTYTESEILTSSYRGLFARLLARMARDKLTGDQLLAQMAYLQFSVFMKLATEFNRLDRFLATVPSPDIGLIFQTSGSSPPPPSSAMGDTYNAIFSTMMTMASGRSRASWHTIAVTGRGRSKTTTCMCALPPRWPTEQWISTPTSPRQRSQTLTTSCRFSSGSARLM
jgi:hypothetical protein